MRILHVLDHSLPLHSGYVFRTLAILTQQRALGWETLQLTGPKQGAVHGEEEVADGWHFYRTPPYEQIWARLPIANQVAVVAALEKRLDHLARILRPDIIHAHSPALNGLAAVRVGRRLDLPVVYEVRAFWEDAAVDHGTSCEGGPRYRLTRALETWVMRRAQAVTTISQGLRDDIAARGIPEERLTVIPNGVDIDRFTTARKRDERLATSLGLQGRPVLGFIGSFYGYEGLDLLLQALPEILGHRPDARVLLVGGGPQEDALKRQARELGLAGEVIFTGRVPHDQVARYYALVDILVYPRKSKRITELVTPLKPLEAMAQHGLVLASDVGGHRELIEDGRTGILFPAGDAHALADAALRLLNEPERWPELRANGRCFVEEERNWAASVARYRDIYQRLVHR